MKYYVPGFNDEVVYLNEELIVPENKLIELVKKIYYLDKQYKLEITAKVIQAIDQYGGTLSYEND